MQSAILLYTFFSPSVCPSVRSLFSVRSSDHASLRSGINCCSSFSDEFQLASTFALYMQLLVRIFITCSFKSLLSVDSADWFDHPTGRRRIEWWSILRLYHSDFFKTFMQANKQTCMLKQKYMANDCEAFNSLTACLFAFVPVVFALVPSVTEPVRLNAASTRRITATFHRPSRTVHIL